jgi:hypothetical protein
MDVLTASYGVLMATALLQAALMLLHAWEHRRFHRSRLLRPAKAAWQPRVTLFAPCKGLDPDLETNLRRLLELDYPDYEICFIVDRDTDAAIPVIESLRQQRPREATRIVVAGLARDCGQKVHNLIAATSVASSETEVFAFVDSDARPRRDWLTRLVDRLESEEAVVSTGYRWYCPARMTFANLLLSAINNLVAGLMGPHGFNFVWGGSWAIRASQFRKLGLPLAWHGSLSDDLLVTRLVRAAGMRVAYEPHCLISSSADMNLAAVAEFVRRQYVVTRVCMQGWWYVSFCSGLVANVAWATSLLAGIYWAATGGPWPIAAAAGLLLYALNGGRAALCMSALSPFIDSDRPAVDAVSRCSIWGWPVVFLANWIGMAAALSSNRITWRGIGYRLISATRTEITSGPVLDDTRLDSPEWGELRKPDESTCPTPETTRARAA